MILQLLRSGTAALHERVERTVDIPGHLGSLSNYTVMLARFHGFYAPLEDLLAGVGDYESVLIDIAARRKAHLIRDDLRTLGYTPEAVAVLPACPILPTVARLAEALGCLYVLEGSTLGGQFIRREVAARLGLTPDRGCAFFAGYGERTGAMWKAFGAAVTAHADAHPEDRDVIVAAAVETFTRLDEWFTGESA